MQGTDRRLGRRDALGVPLLVAGAVADAVPLADIPTLRGMYPDVDRLATFGDHAQVVVSEPLNDLPGAFLEVAESTVAILDPSGYRHEPFLAA